MVHSLFVLIIGVSLSLSTSYMHASASSVSFSLTHRDAESSPLRSVEADPADLPSDMPMRSFVAAGRALSGRINMQEKLRKAGKPLMGKLFYGSGEYLLTVPVGTPSQSMIFLIDTGSELTWTRCSPCLKCPNSTAAPPFSNTQSSSFHAIGCSSDLCRNSVGLTLQRTACVISSAGPSRCLFEVDYADNSRDTGFLSIDSFHLGPAFSKPFVFGCATSVVDTYAGLVGLNAGPFSFPSQLFAGSPDMPRKFAYCLPDIIKSLNLPGRIKFGNYKPPAEVRYTPLEPPYGLLGSISYYVKLEGISVGETFIKVQDMEDEGVKGAVETIFDSGTTVTHLVKPVYDEMVREMRRQTVHLGPFNMTHYSLCYKAPLSAMQPPKVPRISMHFAGGLEMQLGRASILAPAAIDNTSIVFCLAFRRSSDNPNIINKNLIGNYQQQNYWVEYNLETSSLGLAKAKCANYN